MMSSGFPDTSVGKESACNSGDPGSGRSAGERDRLPTLVFLGFPCSSAGKESACNTGDPGLIPGSGRSSGEGIGYSLQYSWASLWLSCNVGDLGSIPGLGRSPGEGEGYPL